MTCRAQRTPDRHPAALDGQTYRAGLVVRRGSAADSQRIAIPFRHHNRISFLDQLGPFGTAVVVSSEIVVDLSRFDINAEPPTLRPPFDPENLFGFEGLSGQLNPDPTAVRFFRQRGTDDEVGFGQPITSNVPRLLPPCAIMRSESAVDTLASRITHDSLAEPSRIRLRSLRGYGGDHRQDRTDRRSRPSMATPRSRWHPLWHRAQAVSSARGHKCLGLSKQ